MLATRRTSEAERRAANRAKFREAARATVGMYRLHAPQAPRALLDYTDGACDEAERWNTADPDRAARALGAAWWGVSCLHRTALLPPALFTA